MIMCSPEVLSRTTGTGRGGRHDIDDSSDVVRCLSMDLRGCLAVLPESVCYNLVSKIKIWVNWSYKYGARDRPVRPNHTTAHHDPAWLSWAQDRPDKAPYGIEIYNWLDYYRMRLHWNGCGLLLHELCHLIHQHCLNEGLQNRRVVAAYQQARQSALYDNVRRRDWVGKSHGDQDLAYAMKDYKEFFAEMSVTYLASSAYEELDHFCCQSSLSKSSPPLMEPFVVAQILHRIHHNNNNNNNNNTSNENGCDQQQEHYNIHPYYQECREATVSVQHCNKFYPFTRGQLSRHDPSTLQVMEQLWNKEIATWEGIERNDNSAFGRARFCNKPRPCLRQEQPDDSDNDCFWLVGGGDSLLSSLRRRWFAPRKSLLTTIDDDGPLSEATTNLLPQVARTNDNVVNNNDDTLVGETVDL